MSENQKKGKHTGKGEALTVQDTTVRSNNILFCQPKITQVYSQNKQYSVWYKKWVLHLVSSKVRNVSYHQKARHLTFPQTMHFFLSSQVIMKTGL